MGRQTRVLWSVKELVEVLKARQMNEFDANFVVTGRRGEGKSTLLFKIFNRFKRFKPWRHIVYSRGDVLKLLKTQKFGICWDDEAIVSAYKRDFQSKDQQELIKTITMYRDNFNIYGSAIPFFYSLDKDLRELIFMHIHVIQRGLAVIFIQKEDNIHGKDPWDSKNNEKLELGWQKKLKNNPKFVVPYNKISTFAGYLVFGKLTEKQEKLYKELKKKKRDDLYNNPEEKEPDWIDKVYNQLINYKLSNEALSQMCLIEGEQYVTVRRKLSEKLRNNGILDKKLPNFLKDDKKFDNPEEKVEIAGKTAVPKF